MRGKRAVVLRLPAAASLLLAPGTALAQAALPSGESGDVVRTGVALAVLAILPSLVIAMTSFSRIAIVLAMVRHAFGMPETPPNSVLVRQGRIAPDELRKAFVRTLLADSLGEELADSLEFQSMSDHVLRIIEDSESGRDLIAAALAELE